MATKQGEATVEVKTVVEGDKVTITASGVNPDAVLDAARAVANTRGLQLPEKKK